MRIYASATDSVNNHPYKVLTSSYYSPAMPDALISGDLDPLYTNYTQNHPVTSMLPLKYLIDMHSTRQSFTVIEDIDVIRIFHSLDAYLLEIQDSIPHNPEVRLYAEKVLVLRAQAYTNFVRILNRHPDWRAAYGEGTLKLLKLFELFAAPDFDKHKKRLDPIEQLRDPPVVLAQNSPSTAGDYSNTTVSISGVPYYSM